MGGAEGVQRATADFVCSHSPLELAVKTTQLGKISFKLDVPNIPAAESRRIPLSAVLPLPPGHDPAKALHKT